MNLKDILYVGLAIALCIIILRTIDRFTPQPSIGRDTVIVHDTLPAPPPVIKYLKGEIRYVPDVLQADSLRMVVRALEQDTLRLFELVQAWQTRYEDSLAVLSITSFPLTKSNSIDLRLKPRPVDRVLIYETKYLEVPWYETWLKYAGCAAGGYLIGRASK